MADNTTLNAASGTFTAGDDDIGGVKYQRVKLIHGVDGTNDGDSARGNPFPVGKYFASRADTYTGVGNGTAVDVSVKPCSKYALQVKGAGATPTVWTVRLEGSLDGTTYTEIMRHSSANPVGNNADGATVWVEAGPFLYFRSRCSDTLTLGSATNIVATIVGMQ